MTDLAFERLSTEILFLNPSIPFPAQSSCGRATIRHGKVSFPSFVSFCFSDEAAVLRPSAFKTLLTRITEDKHKTGLTGKTAHI